MYGTTTYLSACSDEEWSDDEKAEDTKGGGGKDDLEELDEMQLGELLAREQRARHMGLSQVRTSFIGVVHATHGGGGTCRAVGRRVVRLGLLFCLPWIRTAHHVRSQKKHILPVCNSITEIPGRLGSLYIVLRV